MKYSEGEGVCGTRLRKRGLVSRVGGQGEGGWRDQQGWRRGGTEEGWEVGR